MVKFYRMRSAHCGHEMVQSPAMYRMAITLLATLIILAIGISFFVYRDGARTYTNSVHAFSLLYPHQLDVREYGDDNAVFGNISADTIAASAESRIITVQGQAGQSLDEAVSEQLQNLCAADGPSQSFSCTGMQSSQPFITDSGREGFVIVMKGELKNLETGSANQIPKGPYYIIPLSTSATISKVLVIHPPLNITAAEAEHELLDAIARSVTLQ
jgi:hypothetical protein